MEVSEMLTLTVQITIIMSFIGGVVSYIFLTPLNKSIMELRRLIQSTQEQQRLIDLRLTRAEESTKSAHRRLDGLEDVMHHGKWGG